MAKKDKGFRSRPRDYVTMRAGDILPHPRNPRTHDEEQKEMLEASLEEFGDVRSLLCYRSPGLWPGQVVNIDGHLRTSLDPDREVKVELLTDLTDEEAEALLLTLDPLAALAGFQQEAVEELRERSATSNQALQGLWASVGQARVSVGAALEQARKQRGKRAAGESIPERFSVLIECRDEQEQVALLRRFKQEGLTCKALTV